MDKEVLLTLAKLDEVNFDLLGDSMVIRGISPKDIDELLLEAMELFVDEDWERVAKYIYDSAYGFQDMNNDTIIYGERASNLLLELLPIIKERLEDLEIEEEES